MLSIDVDPKWVSTYAGLAESAIGLTTLICAPIVSDLDSDSVTVHMVMLAACSDDPSILSQTTRNLFTSLMWAHLSLLGLLPNRMADHCTPRTDWDLGHWIGPQRGNDG